MSGTWNLVSTVIFVKFVSTAVNFNKLNVRHNFDTSNMNIVE